MKKETTGERIKKFRLKQQLKQTDLAEMLNVKKSTVSMWEKGNNSPGVEKLSRICDILKVTPSVLLGYEGEQPETEPLTENEQKLVDIYKSVSKSGKDIIMTTAENIQEYEDSQTTLLIPMINEGRIPTTELDYYDQAAGMGTGAIVENAIPQKIKVVTNQVPPETDFVIRVYGDSMEPLFHSGDKLYIQSTKTLNIGDIGVFSFEGEQLVKELGKGVLISRNKQYEPIKITRDLYIQGKVLGRVN